MNIIMCTSPSLKNLNDISNLDYVAIEQLCLKVNPEGQDDPYPHFFIPDYQRGYRWTAPLVNDLLDDLFDFCRKNKTDSNAVYCMQPLVVKYDSAQKRYEVIDGQQRLTTVRLLLGGLKREQTYSIYYATRSESKGYICDIVKLPLEYMNAAEKKKEVPKSGLDAGTLELAEQLKKKSQDNVDFYHMWYAYLSILTYLQKYAKDLKDEAFLRCLLRRVQFIWYQPNNEESKNVNNEESKNVFKRLNIGKIKLTDSELIKALMLKRQYAKNTDGEAAAMQNDNLRVFQQEIALQWDEIERTLQSNEFWYFLQNGKYHKATRIDFVFSIIFHRDECKLGKERWDNCKKYDESLRTFRYFYEVIMAADEDKREDCIRRIWQKVMAVYLTLCEWFQHLELYHYIGFLLSRVGGHSIVNFQKDMYGKEDTQEDKTQLYVLWNACKDKGEFMQAIKDEIKEALNIKVRNYDADSLLAELKSIQYEVDGVSKRQSHPILLLHNLQTVVMQNKLQKDASLLGVGTFYKFPFHLYKTEHWDIEHIEPATPNAMDNGGVQRGWLLGVFAELEIRCTDGNDKQNQHIKGICSDIEAYINNRAQRKSWDELFESINESAFFGENALGYNDPKKKNLIWNYALLDRSTNRSYHNDVFSLKRRKLIGKDRGKLIVLPSIVDGKLKRTSSGDCTSVPKEEDARSAFIPPCTKYAFMKYYNRDRSNPNCWTESDAEQYLNDMVEKLVNFFEN